MKELPDGSGFFVASLPLPEDHWVYKRDAEGFTLPPPMPLRMGTDNPHRHEFVEKVKAAARYAVRASTMSGREMDFDPDAMLQNFVVGLLGYHTPDGLSGETFGNPTDIPEKFNP